jgi:hypothetical protein
VTAERQELPLARACMFIGLSRSWYYQRQRHEHPDDTSLQDEIEKIVLGCPARGLPRSAEEVVEARASASPHPWGWKWP